MRTYEFSPAVDLSPVFVISISEGVQGERKVKTSWRDLDGHLSRLKKAVKGTIEQQQSEKFKKQLTNFWRSVCKVERKYRPGMVEEIISSVVDPDLKEFLAQNS